MKLSFSKVMVSVAMQMLLSLPLKVPDESDGGDFRRHWQINRQSWLTFLTEETLDYFAKFPDEFDEVC